MANFSIGLTGLNAAYTALDTVGNNIANAATEGYHRQRIELVPASVTQNNQISIGGGVDVAGIRRLVDGLLEREQVRQESLYGEVSQELTTLSSVETLLGEFSEGGGLNATMDAFFDALTGLGAHPLESVWRSEVVSSAGVLATEFRRLGDSLTSMGDQIIVEAQDTVASMNSLTRQIAELNGEIQATEINGGQANNLRDRRDHLIVELAKLASVETQARDYGVVDISVAGLPVVTGSLSVDIDVAMQSDQTLAAFAAGTDSSGLGVTGGRLGGLLSLKNELLPGLAEDLDKLAGAIITGVNQAHVQGLGTAGAFDELTGWAVSGDDLSEADPPITDGSLFIRLTNTATGEVERHRIDVDTSSATPDTLETIAAKLSAITGLNASVDSARLHVVSELGYTFDFMPAVLPEPTTSTLTAATPPDIAISGAYTGDTNRTFTFTVVGSGSVGNGTLRLDVTNDLGETVSNLNIGSGYAAGDLLVLANGLKVSIGLGDLNAGDSFEVQALATADTSGLLASVGLNTFFSGSTASDMRVCDCIADSPDRIATAFGADLTDNLAALEMARVSERTVESLAGMTPSEYYHRTTANLGQEVALRQSRQENTEAMLQNLSQRQAEISGVNINDEAAQLLVFEKMFQAMAKYITTLQTALDTLMSIT